MVRSRHLNILGVHQGIVKLYPASEYECLSDKTEMVLAYLAPHTRDDLQTKGNADGQIVSGTMYQ
jgi:hypothetical protein